VRTARARLRRRPLAIFAFGEAALFQRLRRKRHCPIVDVSACGLDALGDVGGRKGAVLVEDLRDRRADGLARLGRFARLRLAPELRSESCFWLWLLFCLRPRTRSRLSMFPSERRGPARASLALLTRTRRWSTLKAWGVAVAKRPSTRQALRDDRHLRNGLNICSGRLSNEAVASALNAVAIPLDAALAS
jgi:hypothetical protein